MKKKSKASKVFFLPWERRKEFGAWLERIGAVSELRGGDFIAIKMHFGERGGVGFIEPKYVRPVIKLIRNAKGEPFLTDTNTIYRGPRKDALGHLAVAAEHGFSQNRLQTPVIIADGLRGEDHGTVEVKGEHFERVKIASGILQADFLMVLSHFKGHLVAGVGGALKNLGMGCGARLGKFEMHSSVAPSYDSRLCEKCGACVGACGHEAISLTSEGIGIDVGKCVGCGECVVSCPFGALGITWNEGASRVQERFVEYAAGAVKGKRAFYVNFVKHITAHCDCMGLNESPISPDIGILASTDPLAIDQASLDLVLRESGDVFATAHPEVDATVQLVHAEKMGLGSRQYELVES